MPDFSYWASNETSSGKFTLVMPLVIDLQLNTGPECQISAIGQVMGK